jgi:formylglycine-generating enzyme required for sulfatase activity
MKRFSTFSLLSLLLSCASIVQADTFGSGANTFDIEFVNIGNPDNTAETTGNPNPAGSVDYCYRMGKYEVSEDMIAKANAKSAADGDPLNITFFDFPGVDKPATGISWYEAAQFVNWLNTSTGHTPAYKFDVGANFQLWQSGDAGYNLANPFRNSLAYYSLPSTDEWFKAAYYDPVADVYYDYPTGSNSIPDGIDFASDTNFDVVFFDGGANDYPNDITDVGVLSPYGTAGQGGNVFEWEESAYDLVNNSTSESRGVRGGSWYYTSVFDLRASDREYLDPAYEGSFEGGFGFRVASIPEPNSFLLLCIGALSVAAVQRRQPFILHKHYTEISKQPGVSKRPPTSPIKRTNGSTCRIPADFRPITPRLTFLRISVSRFRRQRRTVR